MTGIQPEIVKEDEINTFRILGSEEHKRNIVRSVYSQVIDPQSHGDLFAVRNDGKKLQVSREKHFDVAEVTFVSFKMHKKDLLIHLHYSWCYQYCRYRA
jgi:hypothetical protein